MPLMAGGSAQFSAYFYSNFSLKIVIIHLYGWRLCSNFWRNFTLIFDKHQNLLLHGRRLCSNLPPHGLRLCENCWLLPTAFCFSQIEEDSQGSTKLTTPTKRVILILHFIQSVPWKSQKDSQASTKLGGAHPGNMSAGSQDTGFPSNGYRVTDTCSRFPRVQSARQLVQ